MSLFTELKRRNVFKVGIAYLVVAWLVIQVADVMIDNIGAPGWLFGGILLILGIGFPVALLFAWAFEMTPEGIKREKDVDREQSLAPRTGRKLDHVIIVALAVAVVYLLADRLLLGDRDPRPDEPVASATPAAAVQPRGPDTYDPDQPSIAVLPFVNMSPDPDQEYFSDGLAEELLNRLAQTTGLRVAARTSAFQFKGQNLDVADIARQLNVSHVLEGSVRKSGDRLRITAQLIKAEDGFHLWSETYERTLDDIFAIQDDISTAITDSLQDRLGISATAAQDRTPTANLDAYETYLQGRFFLAKRGGANLLTAIDRFRNAADLDPEFADAWSGLAITYSLLPSYTGEIPVAEAREFAVSAAQKAIALEPENAEAYLAMGRAKAHYDVDIPGARSDFQRAVELAPNDATVANIYGDFLTLIGDFDGAETWERRALDLDPLAAVQYSDLAGLYLMLHRVEDALPLARRSAQLAPDSYPRLDGLIFGLMLDGQFGEAEKLIEFAAREVDGNPEFISDWICSMAYLRKQRVALEQCVRDRLATSATVNDVNDATTAIFLIGLGDPEAAVAQLDVALAQREYALTWPNFVFLPEQISTDPDWLAFWSKPPLSDLIEIRRANGYDGPVGFWNGILPP